MIILITGVTGFVGKNLKEYLSNGSNQILSLPLRNDNWEEYFDFNCDALIHLAGKAHDLTNSLNDEEYYKVNRDLTINIFEKFLKSNIRDFIFFSSVKAAADTVDGVLTEKLPFISKDCLW
ncbi:NAD-dependent epimerase/dehydratase family protein [Sphingobacterium daejeonense]|uniref:NAD-dependent epimerase/dehydratase family protein n=1 Tax=Sphingobacterium daejeonense TaxID=371142 RepID=UPI0010C4BC1C|nr:NAD-dependent epimerase/dehydratase family protein [Sphingobacterium daejeonense]VTQ07312.1 UDP-glucose 4-epimerase [Sphingobacterium daejeonense]